MNITENIVIKYISVKLFTLGIPVKPWAPPVNLKYSIKTLIISPKARVMIAR